MKVEINFPRQAHIAGGRDVEPVDPDALRDLLRRALEAPGAFRDGYNGGLIFESEIPGNFDLNIILFASGFMPCKTTTPAPPTNARSEST